MKLLYIHCVCVFQSMLCSLVIDQPVDPISYLIGLLQRSSDDGEVAVVSLMAFIC